MTVEALPRYQRPIPELAPPGAHHAFCKNPKCRELLRTGRPRYVGLTAPGLWLQCRDCGQWLDG